MQQLGLGAVLTFASKGAEGAMGRAQAAFTGLHNSAKKAVSGVAQVGRATGAAGIAMAPLSLGMAAAASQAAEFDLQMGAVQAVAGADGIDKLEAKARELGSTTSFNATQVAQGMELMARAGFETEEVLSGVRGILSAAAAEGMGLAEATDVVTNTLRGMTLQASDTQRVADVLALTSAKTNSSISSLGHSFSYGAAQARNMGLGLEDAAATFGALSNAGLAGSSAGTNFSNMMATLAKPTKEGAFIMKQLGLSVEEAFKNPAEKGGPMVALIEQFGSKLERIKSPVEKARIATELFGQRGQRAFNALMAGGANAKEAAGKLHTLMKTLKDASGAAKKMEDARLDTFSGQVQVLGAKLHALDLELFLPLVRSMKPAVKAVGESIMGFVTTLQALRAGDPKAGEGVSAMVVAVAKGVHEAFQTIDAAIAMGRAMVTSFSDTLIDIFGPELVSKVTSFATVFAFVGAAVAPLLVALGGIGFVLTSVVIPIVTGLASVFMAVVSTVLGPVGLALIGLVALFSLLQTEGESYGQTAIRLWGVIRDGALAIWTEGIQPFITGLYTAFLPVIETLSTAWVSIKDSIVFAWTELFGFFTAGAETTTTDWLEVGRKVGSFIGAVIGTIAELFAMVIRVTALVGVTLVQFGAMVFDYIAMPFKMVWNLFKQVGTAVLEILSGDLLNGFKRLGLAIIDFMLEPLRTVLSTFVRISDMAHLPVPQELRDFVDKEINRPVLFDEKPVPNPTEALADQKKEGSNVNVQVMGPPAPEVKVTNKIQVDGRDLSISMGKQQTEYLERAGAKTEHWQRRAIVEHGALTVQKR